MRCARAQLAAAALSACSVVVEREKWSSTWFKLIEGQFSPKLCKLNRAEIVYLFVYGIDTNNNRIVWILAGISQASRRHLTGIKGASRRNLAGISQASRRHLASISQASCRHLAGISHASSKHLVGISLHLLEISQTHHSISLASEYFVIYFRYILETHR